MIFLCVIFSWYDIEVVQDLKKKIRIQNHINRFNLF